MRRHLYPWILVVLSVRLAGAGELERLSDQAASALARAGQALAEGAVEAPRPPQGQPVQRPAVDAKTKLTDATYVVFDFETTGLYPEVNKIIELGAVKFRLDANGQFQQVAEFATLVDPGVPIPPFIVKLTGIDDAAVKGQPKADKALGDFLKFIADADVLMAHNARFDVDYLAYNLKAAGLPQIRQPIVDTKELARTLFPGLASYSNSKLAKAWNIQVGTIHRGLADSHITGRVFAHEARKIAEGGAFGDARWGAVLKSQTPFDAAAEHARAFEGKDTPATNPLPADADLPERVKEADYRLYKAGKNASLVDIAREMGVSYFQLRDRLREIERTSPTAR